MTLTIADLVIPPNNTKISGFVYNEVTDWYSGGTAKTETRPKPLSDGDFAVNRVYYSSMVLSFEGVYVGPNAEETADAKTRFSGLKKQGKRIEITYEDAKGITRRYGTVASTKIPHTNSKTTFKWFIDILCRDPKRYGEEQVRTTGLPQPSGGIAFPMNFPFVFGPEGSVGRVRLTNSGNADATVEIEVSGGLEQGCVISDVTTGEALIINRYIPYGSTIYLNSRNGSATIDNQSTIATSVTGDWFRIPAGQTHTFQFTARGAVFGAPLMTIRSSPTFE